MIYLEEGTSTAVPEDGCASAKGLPHETMYEKLFIDLRSKTMSTNQNLIMDQFCRRTVRKDLQMKRPVKT